MLAQRDYTGIDLHDTDACPRQVTITKLGERAAAEPDHQDMLGFGQEQQECHHLARVRDHQCVRIVKSHGALYVGAGKEEVSLAGTVDDERPRKRACHLPVSGATMRWACATSSSPTRASAEKRQIPLKERSTCEVSNN